MYAQLLPEKKDTLEKRKKCIGINVARGGVFAANGLVRAISGFDAVAAIRLHSAILCYSFGIPAVNLLWNQKVKLFYQDIGRRKM